MVFGVQVGFSGKMEPSEINVKAVVTDGMNVTQAFPGNVDLTIQVECDTGQTFVWDTMRRTGTLDITAGENSEIDLKYVGGTPLETA